LFVAENFTFQMTNKSQEPNFRFQRGGVSGMSALVEGTGFGGVASFQDAMIRWIAIPGLRPGLV
jgi:hypothetical protein